MNLPSKMNRQGGFTLMELVVTLALLGLLAMLAAPLAEMAVQRSREQALREGLREVRGAIDKYKAAWDRGLIKRETGDSGYPPSLKVLVDGVANQKSPSDEKLYFLRRVPRDPFAPAERLSVADALGAAARLVVFFDARLVELSSAGESAGCLRGARRLLPARGVAGVGTVAGTGSGPLAVGWVAAWFRVRPFSAWKLA